MKIFVSILITLILDSLFSKIITETVIKLTIVACTFLKKFSEQKLDGKTQKRMISKDNIMKTKITESDSV